MKLIIDAISNGSGGARRHLSEILKFSENEFCHFDVIEVWGPKSFLEILPDNLKIKKKSHSLLNYGTLGFFIFNLLLKKKFFNKSFGIIFSPFGNFTLNIHPYVSMSRNMLMFDKKERRRFGLGYLRLKLKLLYFINSKSFKNADGLIFLSKFAKNQINKTLSLKNPNQTIIHHGISPSFNKPPNRDVSLLNNKPKFLYVSHLLPYKHHIQLIESIIELSNEGYKLSLLIIGDNNYNKIGNKVKKLISTVKNADLIEWKSNIGLNEVRKYYHSSNFFIYSSTCENMPNTLIEAMSSGLPILCSNSPPMPEFLQKAGIYYDPLSKNSIKKAIIKVLKNPKIAMELANESYNLSKKYSWKTCAKDTFRYLNKISKEYKNVNLN